MKTLLLGDVCPTEYNDHIFAQKDVATLFTDVVTLFEGNDVNFVNLECALTLHDKPIVKIGPALKGCPQTADVLKMLGVNYCGLANNHSFDYGIQGIRDTFAALDSAGIVYTGFGDNYEDARRNLIIEKNGEKFGIVTVSERQYTYALEDRMGCRSYDEYDTMEDIRKAKAECDRVFVAYHGGKEGIGFPSPRIRKMCHAMVQNGADVILCQHSHCVGCYEEYRGAHILYGQGNHHFLRAEYHTPELEEQWNNSLAVKYDTATNEIEMIPLTATGNGGICIATGERREKTLREMEVRNRMLADESYRGVWHNFCEKIRGQYQGALANGCVQIITGQEKEFGFYVDNQSHIDVWQELFHSSAYKNER